MKIAAALIALVSFGFAGCAYPPSPPGAGVIYTDVQGPLGTNPGTMGSKVGMAESQSILGLVAQGDSSIDTAAKAGGITEITHVDFKSWSVLGVVSKFTTVVHGN